MTEQRWWCEYAWVDDACHAGVLVVAKAGRIVDLRYAADPSDAHQLRGLALPGFANCHSHAFHRALRGRTQHGTGSFWTWRKQMYAVAARLDPDSYFDLARAVYAEMVLAGITTVGEFHYVHHQPDGTPYADANVMGEALIAAASEAGIRLTLLDTCYLSAGFGAPLEGAQVRFGDGSAQRWADRVDQRRARGHVVLGAAIHSVRAVSEPDIRYVAAHAASRDWPLHAHLSEQTAENDRCLDTYGRTPTELLADCGALGPRTTAVHATHLTDRDIALLGASHTAACFCPTTERDLADGIGPARQLADAGSPLTLGSDSHAVIDMSEEARAVELNARLATHNRGHFAAADLLRSATTTGHTSLGWPDAGKIAIGQRCDLVAIDIATPRTAGFTPQTAAETAIFAATANDITDVVIDGKHLVRNRHHQMGDVGIALSAAIGALT